MNLSHLMRFVVAAVLVLGGCSDDVPTRTATGVRAATGSAGAACYPNGTCDIGLDCIAGYCSSDESDAGNGDGSSGGTGSEPALECVENRCVITFENLQPRRSKTAEVTIRSIGGTPLQITSIQFVSGSDKLRFSDQMIVALSRFGWEQGPPDPFNPSVRTWVDTDGMPTSEATAIVLEPETFITIGLSITPSATGETGCPDDGTGNCGDIVIATNAPDNREIRIAIVVDSQSGRPSISPSTLDFAPAVAGVTQERELLITNNGAGPLQIQAITGVETPPTLSWTESNSRPLPLLIGQGLSATYNVTWTPASNAESLSGTSLLFESNAFSNGSVGVALTSSGTGEADIEVSETGLDLGASRVGTLVARSFDICNRGGAMLSWAINSAGFSPSDVSTEMRIATGADVAAETLALGGEQSLASQACQTLFVQYTASSNRTVTGNYDIVSNDPQTRTIRFAVAAGPAAPFLSVGPTQLYFSGSDAGSTTQLSFVLSNKGRADLQVTAINKSQDRDAEFTTDLALPATLAPGEARRVIVRYARAASDSASVDNGRLDLVTNDPRATGAGGTIFLFAYHEDGVLPPECSMTISPAEPYQVGDILSLDASNTILPVGGTFTAAPYLWSLVAPAGSAAAVANPFSAVTTLLLDAPGEHALGLTASATAGGQTTNCEQWRSFTVAP
jgi:hypothetical protein